jgi:hypothetical protein
MACHIEPRLCRVVGCRLIALRRVGVSRGCAAGHRQECLCHIELRASCTLAVIAAESGRLDRDCVVSFSPIRVTSQKPPPGETPVGSRQDARSPRRSIDPTTRQSPGQMWHRHSCLCPAAQPREIPATRPRQTTESLLRKGVHHVSHPNRHPEQRRPDAAPRVRRLSDRGRRGV